MSDEPNKMSDAQGAQGAQGKSSPETSRALDDIIAEAKTHLDVRDSGPSPDLDWSRLEARLMAQIEEEKKVAPITAARRSRRDSILRGAALALAVAASVTIYVRRDQADKAQHAALAEHVDPVSASSLRSTEGSGEIRIGGVVASTPGYVVHAGDVIDADGARAVFDRPQKVAWLLEQNTDRRDPVTATAHARVKSAGESLVLNLDHGVIEAQVVPVPTGEAFAVDIPTAHNLVRVAVHGTHLRVERDGNHVSVDLTEGVVSIGVPPRTGVTIGTLVTAPAHVELDATDLGTIRVDHEPRTVRAAIPLNGQVSMNNGNAAPPSLAPTAAEATQAPALIANAPKQPAQPKIDSSSPKTVSTTPPTANLTAREAIIAGIRECAAKAASNKRGVGIDDEASRHAVVNSNLRLHVLPSGKIELAQFSPPLAENIQSCAAEVIYKQKLEARPEPGIVTIAVGFSF